MKSVLTAVFVLCAAMAYATSDPPGRTGPPVRSANVKSVTSAAPPRSTSVMGAVWSVNDTPVPGARVQLRNLVSARVVATATADHDGRFMFTNVEGGTYAVELVGNDGKILTVGHAFVIAPGETVATFVRLATRVPWYLGFFSNAAAAVTSTAASEGITALAPVQLSRSSSR